MKALVTVLLAAAIIPTTQRLQIQHLHAHWATMPALAAYFIKRVCDIPFSVSAHAWDIYMDTTFLRQKLCAAEFVVTCTAANVALLRQLGAPLDRVFLCYHGLDFDLLPRPVFERSSDLRILSVGRLVEQKGFSDLIKACHLLKQRNLTFRCVIVGAGPLSSKLRDLIAEYGLDHFVELAGSRSQRGVFDAYRWATTLCTPSVIASDGDRDGIPNVIVEAMSQGLPIVASRVSGIPEIVQSNQTGRLVPPGDPVLLAEALEEISRNPEEARRRAVAAYKLVRIQFDAHKNARFLLRLFEASTPVGKASSPLHIDTVLKHTQ
jgi:glycosyltransferase involved in cell wall biosynthesis